MKKVLLIFLLCAGLAFSLACGSSKQYTVHMKDGKQYESRGEVKYNVHSETYAFETKDGETITIPKADVEKLVEK
ncbi:MAG: YgdI/YgdR family lipoprotein [Deltaproteobacteria bacterium]|nr:YgdI/YgdR family lipoprotein [Deltaproteobacteria bacterium]